MKAAGHRAVALTRDITDPAAVEAAVAAAEAALGPLTLLVNNAGFTDAGDLGGLSLDSWRREIGINLDGPYHCLRAVLPRMAAQGAGAVVNIASVNGVRFFGNPAYSAAKAGVINLTWRSPRSMVAMASAATRCCRLVRTANRSWEIRLEKDPQVFDKLARWYPLGRVAEPEDIAKAVSFLGSADAAYITGASLPVDGGLLAGMNVMIEEFILESKD